MPERSRLWHVASLLGCTALFVVSGLVGPNVPLNVQVAYALAFMLVAGEIVLLARLAVIERPEELVLILFVSVGVLAWQRGEVVSLHGTAAVGAALLLAGSALGAALGARIERPGHLMAVAAISTVADLWSVYDPGGISSKMAESAVAAPDKVVLFALPWPMLGTPHIAPIIGAGDILFTALYVAAFERHGLALRRVLVALMVAYAAGLAAILVTERPVPLLPLLGAAILLSDRRTASLPPHERRTVWLVVAVLVAVLVVRFLR
jgi:hypothetical protein